MGLPVVQVDAPEQRLAGDGVVGGRTTVKTAASSLGGVGANGEEPAGTGRQARPSDRDRMATSS